VHGPELRLLQEGQAVTPHEREMERLAESLSVLNRFDSSMPTTPTTGDDEEDSQ
jgi:hypothetical protein